MTSYSSNGGFDKTIRSLSNLSKSNYESIFESQGIKTTSELAYATPKDSANTASMWRHTVRKTRTGIELVWSNSVTIGDTPLVILLQYGHGTGTGGYVPGRNFIGPVIDRALSDILANIDKVVGK